MQNLSRDQFLAAYDEYAEAIYRHCYFRLFSKPLAEETVQETFLRTWQYLEKGRKIDNLRAFLYRVANNLIIDHSRKRKEEHLDELMEVYPESEPSYDGRRAAETAELAREVIDTLDGLRAEDRDIISMRYLQELDIKEIADILNITTNNTSVRLNRAIQALKNRLAASEQKNNG